MTRLSADAPVITADELQEVLRRAATKSCATSRVTADRRFTLAEAMTAGREIAGVEDSHIAEAIAEVMSARFMRSSVPPDRRVMVETGPQRFRITLRWPSARMLSAVAGVLIAVVNLYLVGRDLPAPFALPTLPFLLFTSVGLGLVGLVLLERTVIEFDKATGAGTITQIVARRWRWTRALPGVPETATLSASYRAPLLRWLRDANSSTPGAQCCLLQFPGGDERPILVGHDGPTLHWVAQQLEDWTSAVGDSRSSRAQSLGGPR
jgi:hypothetical protein